MNITAAKIQLLHLLKGPALSVYLALWFSEGLLGQGELMRATNWCEDAVNESLGLLKTLGYAQNLKRYQGWTLTEYGRLLLLGDGRFQECRPGKSYSQCGSPVKPDSQAVKELPTTPTEPFLPFKVVVSNKDESPQNGNSLFEANLAAMAKYGVKQNERTLALASREGITPELIGAHHKRLLHRRHYQPGLLVVTLEANDVMAHEHVPLPKKEDPRENRFRYIEGEYGDVGNW